MVRSRAARALPFVVVAGLLFTVLAGPAARAVEDPQAVQPSGSDPSLWAWVTARRPTTPSYTPATDDQGNSAGGVNTATRIGIGSYEVTFGGIWSGPCATQGCYGRFNITALSTSQRTCGLVDSAIGPLDAPSDIRVDVACRNGAGRSADSAFSASYLAPRDSVGIVAYFFNDKPEDPAYDPRPEYNFNSVGPGHNELTRPATGSYRAFLPGVHAGTRGNVQVNTFAAVCRVADRSDRMGSFAYAYVDVHCRDFQGHLVDRFFSLTFTDGVGLKGFTGQPAAYLFANRPTATSYHPKAAFRYSSVGRVPSLSRSGIGRYVATLPGMPLGGTAHVTAHGEGKSECQLSSIRKSTRPQRIGVLCFKPNGDRVDSMFYLTFTR